MFARIALPVSYTDYLTYSIPADILPLIRPGALAIVPVRDQAATGVVIELDSSPKIRSAVKPILALGDGELWLTEEFLHLCLYVSQRYVTTPGMVMKVALPPGTLQRRALYLYPGLRNDNREISDTALRIIDRIRNQPGSWTLADLRKQIGHELTELLLLSGGITLSPFKSTQLLAKKGRERWLKLLAPELAVALGKKGAALFHLLQSQGGEIRLASLKELGFSTAIAASLVNKGCAEYSYKPKELSISGGLKSLAPENTPSLTLWQESSLTRTREAIESNKFRGLLLYGVTSSGKTQVYLEAARHALSRGKSVLVLVPEISLTPQIIERFERFLGIKPFVWHSRLSPGERLSAYLMAKRGGPVIVIGTRSAIFAPIGGLGLIVVDEEQDHSYKQDDPAPRYNARDLALERGRLAGAAVVLGSATPSAESYYMSKTGALELLTLPERVAGIGSPKIEIVSTAFQPEPKPNDIPVFPRGFHPITEKLYTEISLRLRKNEQVILLLNRRGYSSAVVCFECGWVGKCPDCEIGWTYHKIKDRMICHFCGKEQPGPVACSQCGSTRLSFRSAGTEKLEEALHSLFPETNIIRLDTDVATKKWQSRDILDDFGSGKYQILLGTQMVAKGHHFPNVTLVGVISADIGLSLPDFRASERVEQLLTQAAGRAGRSSNKGDTGEVIIQSLAPDNPLLGYLKNNNYLGFLEDELKIREALDYPPFKRLVLLVISSAYAHRASDAADRLKDEIQARTADKNIGILGPAESPIFKRGKLYRYQLLLKLPSGQAPAELLRGLNDFMRRSKGLYIRVDIDPVSFM